jgi:hypothetical protein
MDAFLKCITFIAATIEEFKLDKYIFKLHGNELLQRDDKKGTPISARSVLIALAKNFHLKGGKIDRPNITDEECGRLVKTIKAIHEFTNEQISCMCALMITSIFHGSFDKDYAKKQLDMRFTIKNVK